MASYDVACDIHQALLAGLFPPAFLSIPKDIAIKLIAPGIAIGISCYLEGAAVCKRWADEDGEEWDSNKELVGQGVANVLSAAVGGMPVAGMGLPSFTFQLNLSRFCLRTHSRYA